MTDLLTQKNTESVNVQLKKRYVGLRPQLHILQVPPWGQPIPRVPRNGEANAVTMNLSLASLRLARVIVKRGKQCL